MRLKFHLNDMAYLGMGLLRGPMIDLQWERLTVAYTCGPPPSLTSIYIDGFKGL